MKLPKISLYDCAALSANTPPGSKWAVYGSKPDFVRADRDCAVPMVHESQPLVGWVDLVRGRVVELEGRTKYEFDNPKHFGGDAYYRQAVEDEEADIRREARAARCETPEAARAWSLVDYLLDRVASVRSARAEKVLRRKVEINKLTSSLRKHKLRIAELEARLGEK